MFKWEVNSESRAKYKEQFFALLDKSFAISKKGKDYYSYAQYLREIVAAYFNNLRETKRNMSMTLRHPSSAFSVFSPHSLAASSAY